MKNFLFTGFIILLLSAVSCKTTEKGSMTQTQTPTSQTNEKKNISINREELNGTWIIKTAKGKTVIGDSPVEITFDLTNGRIYGNDGCNVINGTAFFENENGDEKGKSVMTLEKRMVDLLNGSWKVTTIDGKKITEENPTKVIDIPEAKLSGFAVGNRMFGGISLDGTAFGIAFTQVATTRMACPDMKTEQLFLSALGKVTGFYMIDNFHAALYQQPQTPIIIIEKVQ